jgi:hypothetical protein
MTRLRKSLAAICLVAAGTLATASPAAAQLQQQMEDLIRSLMPNETRCSKIKGNGVYCKIEEYDRDREQLNYFLMQYADAPSLPWVIAAVTLFKTTDTVELQPYLPKIMRLFVETGVPEAAISRCLDEVIAGATPSAVPGQNLVKSVVGNRTLFCTLQIYTGVPRTLLHATWKTDAQP